MKPLAVFMSLMLLAHNLLRRIHATEAILMVTLVSRSQRGFMVSDIQNRVQLILRRRKHTLVGTLVLERVLPTKFSMTGDV
jgi:hypothetical protein